MASLAMLTVSKIEHLDEARSDRARRLPAGGDGGRLRGHRAPEARGQPDPLDADHARSSRRSATPVLPAPGAPDRLPAAQGGGRSPRHRRLERRTWSAEALVSQVVPGRVFREFAWDGRDASGRVVADGVYRARITLGTRAGRSCSRTRSGSTRRRRRSRR